jgi:hypothetical protein
MGRSPAVIGVFTDSLRRRDYRGSMPTLVETSATPTRNPLVVDALMEALPPSQRRWCAVENCRCSGCARPLLTRDEWMAWYIRQHGSDVA